VDAGIPDALIAWTTSHIHSPWLFLLVLNIVLLVLGSVLEIYGAIIILSPLLAPLAVEYGIDPVHLAVVFLANLEAGFLLPPFGLNLFLSASRFQLPLPRLYKNALPFLLIVGASVLITTYFEPMSTGMLRLLRGAP
jgi:TRAP-type C4-dicarboxylate transport system permease large subunit